MNRYTISYYIESPFASPFLEEKVLSALSKEDAQKKLLELLADNYHPSRIKILNAGQHIVTLGSLVYAC